MGWFCDQQMPVRGSRMVPPAHGAVDAVGGLSHGADNKSMPLQMDTVRKLDDRNRNFMVMFSLCGDFGLGFDHVGGIDHDLFLALESICIELQDKQCIFGGNDHRFLRDDPCLAVVGVGTG